MGVLVFRLHAVVHVVVHACATLARPCNMHATCMTCREHNGPVHERDGDVGATGGSILLGDDEPPPHAVARQGQGFKGFSMLASSATSMLSKVATHVTGADDLHSSAAAGGGGGAEARLRAQIDALKAQLIETAQDNDQLNAQARGRRA